MNIGTILAEAIRISWREKLLWLFAAIPFILILPIFLLPTPDYTGYYETFTEQDAARIISQMFWGLGWGCVASVASFFAGPLSLGGMISGVNRAKQEIPLKFSEILQDVRRSYWRVLLLPLIFSIAAFLIAMVFVIAFSLVVPQVDPENYIYFLIPLCGLLCIFVPVLWFAGIVMFFAITAMVVDDLSMGEAISEAWACTRKDWGKVIGIFIVLTLIQVGLTLVLNLAMGGIQLIALSAVEFSSPQSFMAASQAWWLKLLAIPQYLVLIVLTTFNTSALVLTYLALKPSASEVIKTTPK